MKRIAITPSLASASSLFSSLPIPMTSADCPDDSDEASILNQSG